MSKWRITIKKRTQAGWLMWLLILLPFLFGLLNELLGLPKAIRYTLDVVWLCLLGFMMLKQRMQQSGRIGKSSMWIWLYLLYSLMGVLMQLQSPLFYLWGIRNNFRFYVAYFAFCTFLAADDVEEYLSLFDWLFWLNLVVSLYQYFALGLEGDYLGGIFGVETGANGYSNVFFLIISVKSLVFYLTKREKLWMCLAKCAAMLLVAALAEMKFFFAEFALVLVCAILTTGFTWRKLNIILGGTLILLVCAELLSTIFPMFDGFFSLSNFWVKATSNRGYTSSGDLNRLNAIPQINELWLKNGWQRLFGLGLGNCDTSGFAFLNTPFFEKYGDLHYTWLSYAMIYLETGWIGLVFYFGFFVLVYWKICKIHKKLRGEGVAWCVVGRIMAILCMIISVYNSSLRTEAGYMAYFILAIPFVYAKCIPHGAQ